MKINFILPPLHVSGGMRVLAIYAENLSKKGHVVKVIASSHQSPSFVRKLKTLIKTGKWPALAVGSASHFDGINLSVKTIVGNRKINNNDIDDADVVIATWWETAEWVSQFHPSKGAKVYFIQHHEIFDYLPVDRCKATYRLPMRKIVIAKWLEDVMKQDYGDADVDLVPNAVDHSQFFATPRSKQRLPTVGFLYHKAYFKGVDTTLKVIAELRLIFPQLKVVAFGTEEPDEYLPLPVGTTYYRSPAQESIRNIYAQCDVWITASRTEGFNLPAMEAMACRAPIVSTKAGWPAEAVVGGLNGHLCEVDDVDALVAAAAAVLGMSAPAWEHMSAEAYATTKHVSWLNSLDLFESALLRACKQ